MSKKTKEEKQQEKMQKKLAKKPKMTLREMFTSRSSKAGGFSLIVVAIVLAVIIVLNLIVPKLPSKYTSFDLTSTGKFTIGDETKKVLSSLDKEVNVYYICSEGEEDTYVKLLLDDYASQKNVTVKTVDPVKYPKFASKYSDDEVSTGSIIVNCGERSKVVSSSDLYEYEVNYSTYQYEQSAFKGENAITNAIAYVVSDNLPTISFLKGHGEAELDSTFSAALTSANYDIGSLNLASSKSVPADTECVAIISPASDISESDEKALSDYINGGGNVFMTTDSITKDKFPNLYKLLSEISVEPVDGTVIELDSDHCYNYNGYSINYYLLPIIGSHDITEGLDNYYILMTSAQGFNVPTSLPDGTTVEPLLTTTDKAYSAINIEDKTSSDKEEGDIDTDSGFRLGAAITKGDGKVVYFSSSSFMSSSVNQAVSGANSMLFVKCFNWLCETTAAVSIPSQSLSYEQITLTSTASNALSIIFVFVIPALLILAGIVIVIKRKRR